MKKYLLNILLLLVGGIGGFIYYKFIGCNSGHCPITSNPYLSIISGAILSYLFFSSFIPSKKEKKTED